MVMTKYGNANCFEPIMITTMKKTNCSQKHLTCAKTENENKIEVRFLVINNFVNYHKHPSVKLQNSSKHST